MRVFIGPPGEAEITGGRQVVEVEAHAHDDLTTAIAHIGLAYLERQGGRMADGTPYVSDEDLPEELKAGGDGVNPPPDDGRNEERWQYIMAEIRWAFEQALSEDDGFDQFVIEPGDYAIVPKGPTSFDVHTRKKGVVDMDGWREHSRRRREGLRLFTAYMQYL